MSRSVDRDPGELFIVRWRFRIEEVSDYEDPMAGVFSDNSWADEAPRKDPGRGSLRVSGACGTEESRDMRDIAELPAREFCDGGSVRTTLFSQSTYE